MRIFKTSVYLALCTADLNKAVKANKLIELKLR